MKWLISTLLAVMLFIGGYGIGQATFKPQVVKETVQYIPNAYFEENYPAPITVDQAVEYLRECRLSHQRRVDISKYKSLPAFEGDAEFHAKWVERYDQIRELIFDLQEDSK